MPELRLMRRSGCPGLGRSRKVVPGELEAAQVGGDGVVRAARIKGEAAIEPPAGDARTVTFPEFANDGQQVADKARLVGRVVADGILPGRVVAMVTGVVVVKDQAEVMGAAGIGEIADEVTGGCPSRRDPINGRAGGGKHLQRMTGGEDDVLRACLGGLLDVALDIEAEDGFFEGKPVILPHRLRLRCPMGGDAEATGSEPVGVCLVVGFAPNAASPQRGDGKAGYNFPSGEKRSEGHGERREQL
jgi:hypothetical protein